MRSNQLQMGRGNVTFSPLIYTLLESQEILLTNQVQENSWKDSQYTIFQITLQLCCFGICYYIKFICCTSRSSLAPQIRYFPNLIHCVILKLTLAPNLQFQILDSSSLFLAVCLNSLRRFLFCSRDAPRPELHPCTQPTTNLRCLCSWNIACGKKSDQSRLWGGK